MKRLRPGHLIFSAAASTGAQLVVAARAGQPRGTPMGMTPWFRHGQMLPQGSPSILLFELVLGIALPEVGPGKIHHRWTIS